MTRRNPFTPWFTSVLCIAFIVIVGLVSAVFFPGVWT